MPKPPDYGIIYNWDGNPHGYSEYPQSMDEFLDKVYAPMEETQVGAHFWCVGEHTARWESDVLETVGDVHGRVYENQRQAKRSKPLMILQPCFPVSPFDNSLRSEKV